MFDPTLHDEHDWMLDAMDAFGWDSVAKRWACALPAQSRIYSQVLLELMRPECFMLLVCDRTLIDADIDRRIHFFRVVAPQCCKGYDFGAPLDSHADYDEKCKPGGSVYALRWCIAINLDFSCFDVELRHGGMRHQAHVGHGKARNIVSLNASHVTAEARGLHDCLTELEDDCDAGDEVGDEGGARFIGAKALFMKGQNMRPDLALIAWNAMPEDERVAWQQRAKAA